MSNYHVDFEDMYMTYGQMLSNYNAWYEASVKFRNIIDRFIHYNYYFAGVSADAIRSYFETTHFVILDEINRLSRAHIQLYMVYLADYCYRVDDDNSFLNRGGEKDAVFDANELEELAESYKSFAQQTDRIEEEVHQVLNKISDIYYCGRTNTESLLQEYHNKTIQFINKVHDSVEIVENEHKEKDFIETRQMIISLRAWIHRLLRRNRYFKRDFTEESLREFKDSIIDLFKSSLSLHEKIDSLDHSKLDAFERMNTRFMQEYVEEIEREKERREKEAGYCRVLGRVVTLVGLGVIIIGSGGTATPIVLVSSTSAVSAGGTSFFNSVADNIEENGSAFEGLDWERTGGKVFTDALIGGASGYAGATIAQDLKGVKWIAEATTGPNATLLSRIGGNAIINTSENLVKNETERFFNNYSDAIFEGKTIDLYSVIFDQENDNSLLNIKEISGDVLNGGVSSITKSVIDTFADMDILSVREKILVKSATGSFEEGTAGMAERYVKSAIEQSLVIDENGNFNGFNASYIDLKKVLEETYNEEKMIKDWGGGLTKSGSKAVVNYKTKG